MNSVEHIFRYGGIQFMRRCSHQGEAMAASCFGRFDFLTVLASPGMARSWYDETCHRLVQTRRWVWWRLLTSQLCGVSPGILLDTYSLLAATTTQSSFGAGRIDEFHLHTREWHTSLGNKKLKLLSSGTDQGTVWGTSTIWTRCHLDMRRSMAIWVGSWLKPPFF